MGIIRKNKPTQKNYKNSLFTELMKVIKIVCMAIQKIFVKNERKF